MQTAEPPQLCFPPTSKDVPYLILAYVVAAGIRCVPVRKVLEEAAALKRPLD